VSAYKFPIKNKTAPATESNRLKYHKKALLVSIAIAEIAIAI
jgi:hypothetical protein